MAEGIQELIVSVQSFADNRVIRKMALDLYSEWHERIYTEGMSAEGPIGNYNTTKPLYVNPADSPKSFATLGKPRANGKRRRGKTGWFPSYSAFRQAIGRPTAFVNLQLTEQMKRGTVVSFRGDNVVFGFTNPVEAKKGSGNEKRFGKRIFRLSKDEISSIPRKLAAAKKELGL